MCVRPAPEEDLASVRHCVENFVPESMCPDCSHDECLCAQARADALDALSRVAARLAETEREREEAEHLLERVEALLMQDPAPPPDEVFRFFQRLHGLPEVGAPITPEVAALKDFAEHGLRCDLNPTRLVHADNEAWAAADFWWLSYLRRADENVRTRARAVLGGTTQ